MSRIDSPSSTPRRDFIGGVAAGAGALLVGGWSPANAEAASLMETSMLADEWVSRIKGKYKQVFDITGPNNSFGGAYPLNFINSTKEATKAPDTDITAVAVFRHFAMPLTLNDAVWAKYKLGEIVDVKDPKTNAPATRNVYKDNIPLYTGVTYETLSSKHGVIIVACGLALNVISGMAASKAGVTAEQAKKDFTAGLIPGVSVAASGVYAVNRAQQAGCTYCYAG
ncbi:MAG TPA: twin-arginine translocation signal domain-containing protein [Gemmatimonadaceae bacterium]